jgi:tetratricopeptide (TPR) repeat protein
MKLTILKRFFTLSLSIFLLFGFVELYFKFFSPIPIFDNYTAPSFGIPNAFRPNLQKNLIFDKFPYRVQTGSHKLRNFQLAKYQKPNELFRILCIGGSIFEASGVNNNETFAFYLNKLIKEKFPNKKSEVINAGKSQWELAEFYNYFKNEGYKYKPDLTVIYFHSGELSAIDLTEWEAEKIKFNRLSKNKVEIEIKGLDLNLHLNPSSAFALNLIHSIPFYEKIFLRSHFLRKIEKNIRNNLILKNDKSLSSSKKNLDTIIEEWDIKPDDSIDWKTDYGTIKNSKRISLKSIIYSVGLENFFSLVKKNKSKLLFLVVPSQGEVINLESVSKNLKPSPIKDKKNLMRLDLLPQLAQIQKSISTLLNFPNKIHWTPTGHYSAAVISFNAILNNFLPTTIEQHNKLININSSGLFNDLNGANQRLKILLKSHPSNPFFEAIIHRNNGRYIEAIKALEGYLKIKKNDRNTLLQLGMLYLEIGQPQKSIKVLEKVLIIQPHITPEPFFLMGKAFFHLKQFKKALEYLLRTEKFQEYNLGEVYNQIGQTYFFLNSFKLAEKYWLSAIEKKPDFSGFNINLGLFYVKIGEDKKALEQFILAQRKSPKEHRAFLLAGLIYFKNKHDQKKSLKMFKKVLTLNPQNVIALKHLKLLASLNK